MKKALFFFMLLLVLPFCFSQNQTVEIKNFINDYAGLLSYEQVAEIEPIIKEVYDKGLAEYSVVIINTLNGEDIEGYSYKLAEGHLGDTQKNNGLLLLIALQDRQYRFEVGRGLEPVLPDIIMARIGRNYLEPNFKNGDYKRGIEEASLAIRDTLLNSTGSQYYIEKKEQFSFSVDIGLIIFIFFIIIVIINISSASKSTTPEKKKKKDDYFLAGWILSSMMRGGRGGSGGFSGGGGFGGFGGGSFGGGGAGSHW